MHEPSLSPSDDGVPCGWRAIGYMHVMVMPYWKLSGNVPRLAVIYIKGRVALAIRAS